MADVTIDDVIGAMDGAYPPRLAQEWDSVGLVCGDPAAPVSKVLFTVDATAAVIRDAIAWGAHLVIAHHPLLLRGVDTVGAHTPKGALIHQLITARCGLFTAHTNADSADPGVSDALAAALDITVTGALEPVPGDPVDKWSILVPIAGTDTVRAALFAAGAGRVGNYTDVGWSVTGRGQFRPGAGSNPTIGTPGELETVAEDRLDVIAARGDRQAVLHALRSAHPYEEVAFDLFEMAPLPSTCGLGRIGTLSTPESLRSFTARVRRNLPETAWGVRAAGDPDATIETVAVCGGAGDSLLSVVSASGADAFVTADLRHHPADEHLRAGGPALVDVAHWASEFPWCAQAKTMLDAIFSGNDGWESRVSSVRTDPWTIGC